MKRAGLALVRFGCIARITVIVGFCVGIVCQCQPDHVC